MSRTKSLPPRKKLLLFAGGQAGCRALQTLVLTPSISRLVQTYLWPDYLTTLHYDTRFYGAWEIGREMVHEQERIIYCFDRLHEATKKKPTGLREYNLVALNRDGQPTFTKQKCLDKIADLGIDLIQAACFGRYIPNTALEMVGAKLDAAGKLIQPGRAFNIHPGFTHKKRRDTLISDSRGKDIIKSLVTSRKALGGVPFRAYFMYLTDDVDGGKILGESMEHYLPAWTDEELIMGKADINERIRIGVEVTSCAYPEVLRNHFIRNAFSPDELRERGVSTRIALSFGYTPKHLARAGFKFNFDPPE